MVLLTGATGLVGMEVLARYLERGDRRVCALVRAESHDKAEERIRDTLSTLFGDPNRYADRVLAVAADIEADGLGLDARERERLAAGVEDIVHCAASVSFSLPLERSRQINVEGTRRMLELAELTREHGGLERFCYVSTAYVAGTHTGEFGEHQLEVGQDFHNAYERSKFEAEQLVRSYGERLPIQVFRPSIIVGERRTGWTVSFNVLYAPLKAFARGAYLALPGRRSAPVDVVPVDYVADAVFEIASRPVAPDAGEETYHLVAGREASTVGALMKLSARYFRRRSPWLFPPALYRRLLHPLLVWTSRGRRRRALRSSEVYFPYFDTRARYDDRQARARLEQAGIRTTPVERYFDRLAGFAVGSRWGRVAISRSQARRRVTPRGGAR
jgi:long-chain acyl-CoA synthetase